MEFQHWPKIPRANNVNCYITEKIDGTNAVIAIGSGESGAPSFQVGSRNRWITPENDNYGFARWAYEHREMLLRLGEGYHYGEWWGQGIQRGYGLTERRFSLFDTRRWRCVDGEHNELAERGLGELVSVVPVLRVCTLDTLNESMKSVWYQLHNTGSVAVAGFMRPEGFVVQIGDMRFKVTDAQQGNKLRNAMELFKAAIPDKPVSEVHEVSKQAGLLWPGSAAECAPIPGHPAV